MSGATPQLYLTRYGETARTNRWDANGVTGGDRKIGQYGAQLP